MRLPTPRAILQILFVIAIWYGSDGASASYTFYPDALEKSFWGMNLNELIIIFVSVGAFILLLMQRNISMPASRLHLPVLIFSLTLFVPWVRMCYSEGTIRIPFELHVTLGFYAAYALVFILFQPREIKKLFVILLGIGIAKGLEACVGYVIQPSAESSWAALAEWRDGLVLGMMLVSWLAIYCYRKEIERRNYFFGL